MRVYVNATFNHFRALQVWARGRDARLSLDVATFQVEVKHRHRYFTLYPMFQARIDGRSVHTTELPVEVIGFGGWRPYEPVRHPHSTEKLRFKRFLRDLALPTPEWSEGVDVARGPGFDYVVKADVGSFGKQIFGPFRAGTPPRLPPLAEGAESTLFAEAFVPGLTCKVWFWGGRAFFAHGHDFPILVGNGADRIETLLTRRFAACALDWAGYADREVVLEALRFQDCDLATVLQPEQRCWIDFRYSQRYEPSEGLTPHTDDVLPMLLERSGDQIGRMGEALAGLLKPVFPAPILISVDGMLDREGTMHWLEMNINSIMPPEGYAVMFDDLFA